MSSLIKKISEMNKNGQSSFFVMFGGTSFNFTEQQIKNIWRVKIFAMFGGADIFVPENINLNINSFSLFATIEDKREKVVADVNALTLNIKGFCLFGRIAIKNI